VVARITMNQFVLNLEEQSRMNAWQNVTRKQSNQKVLVQELVLEQILSTRNLVVLLLMERMDTDKYVADSNSTRPTERALTSSVSGKEELQKSSRQSNVSGRRDLEKESKDTVALLKR